MPDQAQIEGRSKPEPSLTQCAWNNSYPRLFRASTTKPKLCHYQRFEEAQCRPGQVAPVPWLVRPQRSQSRLAATFKNHPLSLPSEHPPVPVAPGLSFYAFPFRLHDQLASAYGSRRRSIVALHRVPRIDRGLGRGVGIGFR